jgi:hypothetical protein
MRKRLETLMTVYLLASISIARADASQTLSVQVCNFSPADSQMLLQAEAIAGKIFRDAGVGTAWFTATDPSRPGRPELSRLTLQIFPGRSQRSDVKDAFGIAMTDEKNPTTSWLADVFWGTIEELVTTRTDETVLLGYVMAHEAGHLLGETHAPNTIMADGWNAHDIPRMVGGRVRFSATQAGRLRAAVALRLRTR